MKYVLTKLKKKNKPKNAELAFNTWDYQVKIKKVSDILIVNQKLIDLICLSEINKGLDRLIQDIINYLLSEDDDSEQTGFYYDQLAKERSSILKLYEEKMSKAAIDSYMKKIRFAALELRKRLISYNYQTVSKKGR